MRVLQYVGKEGIYCKIMYSGGQLAYNNPAAK